MPGRISTPLPATTGPDKAMMSYSNDGGDDESPANGVAEPDELGSLSSLISPDDWRLYYLMRELPGEDRARILAFAEMLYNMQRAKKWAKSGE